MPWTRVGALPARVPASGPPYGQSPGGTLIYRLSQALLMATQSDSTGSNRSMLRGLSEALNRYLSLQISLLGVLFMIAGYGIQFTDPGWTDSGVWTVVLFLWGLALFLLGLAIFTVFWWSHQGSGGL